MTKKCHLSSYIKSTFDVYAYAFGNVLKWLGIHDRDLKWISQCWFDDPTISLIVVSFSITSQCHTPLNVVGIIEWRSWMKCNCFRFSQQISKEQYVVFSGFALMKGIRNIKQLSRSLKFFKNFDTHPTHSAAPQQDMLIQNHSNL